MALHKGLELLLPLIEAGMMHGTVRDCLAEAVQAAHTKGGLVVVDGSWAFAGGVNATITGQSGWANVTIIDARGTASGSAFSYKSTGTTSPAAYTVTTISWY